MKKTFAVLLVLCLAVSLCVFGEGISLMPLHLASMENYGAEDCTMRVRFDTATAVDDSLNITYQVYQTDYYPAAQVETLQPGDKVYVYDREILVESVEKDEAENIIYLNGREGLYFTYTEEDPSLMVCDDGTETPSYTEMGSFTFPLAEQVKLSSYKMGDYGWSQEGMDEQVLTPAEVKAFFTVHGDSDREDYLSAWGSAVTLRVADGKVQEITIDWSSDS